MRLTRTRIVATLVAVGTIVVVAIILNAFIFTPATITRPEAPPSVNAVRDRWQYPILLPTVRPDCLAYDAAQTGIVSDDAASNGLALQATLVQTSQSGCPDSQETIIHIREAPFFSSLTGNVTTLTQGRMQFAHAVESTSDGKTRVTLQWRCASVMCRMSSTTGRVLTEDELVRMADSFQIVRPAG